jgi:hypothetical protein
MATVAPKAAANCSSDSAAAVPSTLRTISPAILAARPENRSGECHGELRRLQGLYGGGGHGHLQRALQLNFHAVGRPVLVGVSVVAVVVAALVTFSPGPCPRLCISLLVPVVFVVAVAVVVVKFVVHALQYDAVHLHGLLPRT